MNIQEVVNKEIDTTQKDLTQKLQMLQSPDYSRVIQLTQKMVDIIDNLKGVHIGELSMYAFGAYIKVIATTFAQSVAMLEKLNPVFVCKFSEKTTECDRYTYATGVTSVYGGDSTIDIELTVFSADCKLIPIGTKTVTQYKRICKEGEA